MRSSTLSLLLLLSVGVLGACGTTGGALFDDGRGSYVQENALSGKDSVHVVEGRIYRGMPIDHALAALGPPASQDTTTADGETRIEYTYRSRPNAFDPGNVPRAYIYAVDQTVTDWTNLNRIPRFDAYYEGGM
ncbi:hypothetical protein [Salinibacter grassmerensis]|uniref:hypothetical protein n=1 Tax=Salinibacter grassmerensis TaxID=3040353 RepID=UPI0021E93F7B|nr:hypothetical protein [Salinibacter grassmerensis]